MSKNNNQNDIFITAKPSSEKIRKYIAYYYFHYSNDINFRGNFSFYPNFKHALTIYKDSDILLLENTSIVKPSVFSNIQTLYSINKNKSIKVTIEGKFNKIGIVFNPLGINHFIKKPLSDVLNLEFGDFTYFGEEFKSKIEKAFIEKQLDTKVSILDDFFENKLAPFEENILKNAVGEIIVSNGGIKVTELSEKLLINRKMLLRLFKMHTFMSVEEYRKMVMFRLALNFYQENKKNSNLTEVALFSMYYDQAHFIKHFKSITKETPNSLLSKISKLGSEETYWYFED